MYFISKYRSISTKLDSNYSLLALLTFVIRESLAKQLTFLRRNDFVKEMNQQTNKTAKTFSGGFI